MSRSLVASVVVATRNRAQLLPRLVAALELQQEAGPFEVVVVDDAATDSTPEVLRALAEATPLPLRVERQAVNRGPAAARNVGWQAAVAPVVAFTDDDCLPQPGWLDALLRGLDGVEIAQGRTLPNPTQTWDGWFARAPDVDHERGFYETCNIAYRRDVLAAVGGFDETFGAQSRRRGRRRYVAPAWGEDTDLAWRAKAIGARARFVPEAVVWHDLSRGRLRDELRSLRRRTTNALVVKRHPDVRDAFEHRWFVSGAHRDAAVLVGTVAWATVRPRSPARWLAVSGAGLAWARHRTAYSENWRLWPRTLPQWLIVDVSEVALMAAASVRYRSLLL